jgi:transcriptional regulator with XRE-family HTH domain
MTSREIGDVIERLKEWRKTNQLSQPAAVVVMWRLGFDIRQSTISKWEARKLRPGRITIQVLEMFLEKYPKVECPLGHRIIRAPLPADKVAQVRKLRDKGASLASIAEQFDISISSVSRIARGNQRKDYRHPAGHKSSKPLAFYRRTHLLFLLL